MSKTLEQIQAALKNKYNGPLHEKNGYHYIPWSSMVNWLNEQIGIENYDIAIKEYHQEIVRFTDEDGQEHLTYGYSSVVKLTIRPSDATPFTREGLGFNELQFTKGGTALIDTSAKGAASNGIVRAASLLGDVGGLFLYDKESTMQHTPSMSSTSVKSVLSTAREDVLKNKGFPPSAITIIQTQWDWKRVKELFDDLMQNKMNTADALKKYGLSGSTGTKNEYPF